MATNEQAVATEIERIKNNRYDVKKHFALLFDDLLAAKQEQHPRIAIVEQLLDGNALEQHVNKIYPDKDFVLMFYAHKPESPGKSPAFPDEPTAHTSVLLCKVNDQGQVQRVLNIDGYSYDDYANPANNPLIHQRQIIKAQGTATGGLTPLQRASWENMNCVLYSLTFAERILELFNEQPELMSNLFPPQPTAEEPNPQVSAENLFLLSEGILAGMKDIYVKEQGGAYIYDQQLIERHHHRLREQLANKYKLHMLQEQQAEHFASHEGIDEESLTEEEPKVIKIEPPKVENNPEVAPTVTTAEEPNRVIPPLTKPELRTDVDKRTETKQQQNKHPEPPTSRQATVVAQGAEVKSTPETHQHEQPEPIKSPQPQVRPKTGPETRPAAAKKVPAKDKNNYNFLLNVGIGLGAVLAVGAFVVAALAIAAIITMPPVAAGAVLLAGVGAAGLAAYGLYAAKKRDGPMPETTNTDKMKNQPM